MLRSTAAPARSTFVWTPAGSDACSRVFQCWCWSWCRRTATSTWNRTKNGIRNFNPKFVNTPTHASRAPTLLWSVSAIFITFWDKLANGILINLRQLVRAGIPQIRIWVSLGWGIWNMVTFVGGYGACFRQSCKNEVLKRKMSEIQTLNIQTLNFRVWIFRKRFQKNVSWKSQNFM